MTRALWLSANLMLFFAAAHAASDPGDPSMVKLASVSGCLTCHHIESRAPVPNGSLPIGPAWQDVSARYRDVPGAADQLTRTVLAGSNPYASHWKDKVNGLAMPPNAVAIKEADARALVAWILGLGPQRAATVAVPKPASP